MRLKEFLLTLVLTVAWVVAFILFQKVSFYKIVATTAIFLALFALVIIVFIVIVVALTDEKWPLTKTITILVIIIIAVGTLALIYIT